MKKLFCLLLALCLTLAGASQAFALELKEVGAFPFTDEKLELDIWAIGSPTVIDIETNGMTTWYEDYTGVHVNWTYIPSSADAETKLNLSLASGDYPDIYLCNFSAAQVMLNAKGGLFIPLNDLIERETYYLKPMLEENAWLRDGITAPDGNIYTLFTTDAGVHMQCTNKTFVYQPWLDQYTAATGKGMPQTTAEFEEMLLFFRDHDMNGNGDPSDEYPLMSSYSAWGGDPAAFLTDPFQLWGKNFIRGIDGKASFTANTDGFREGLSYMNKLFEEGLIAEETYVQDVTQLKTYINHAEAKDMQVGVFCTAHVAQYTDLEIMPNALVDYAPIPPLEGPSGLRQAECLGGQVIALYGAITSACENPEVAIRWLDGLAAGPGYDASKFGFEGEQFAWSDEPSITGVTPSRMLTFDERPQNDWWYYSLGPWYDSIEIRYLETNVYGWYGWAHYRAHDAYAPYYVNWELPQITWVTDEGTIAEYNEMSNLFNAYVKQAYTQFILGVMDVDDDAQWQAYLDELNAMGLDRYIELCQQFYYGA